MFKFNRKLLKNNQMNKIKFLILFFSQIAISMNVAQEYNQIKKININNFYEYLPEYFNNIYLGMSFKDFTNIKDTLFLEKINSDSPEWFAFKENVNDYYIDHIIYKFDATPDSVNDTLPLFQINIFFTEIEQLNNYVNSKFGSPQIKYEDLSAEWILKTNKNFVLIVKQLNNEVKLIGTIAGAEWDIDN